VQRLPPPFFPGHTFLVEGVRDGLDERRTACALQMSGVCADWWMWIVATVLFMLCCCRCCRWLLVAALRRRRHREGSSTHTSAQPMNLVAMTKELSNEIVEMVGGERKSYATVVVGDETTVVVGDETTIHPEPPEHNASDGVLTVPRRLLPATSVDPSHVNMLDVEQHSVSPRTPRPGS
jgi:hypothetical protein